MVYYYYSQRTGGFFMQKHPRILIFILLISLTKIPYVSAKTEYVNPLKDDCICIRISAVGDCTLGIDESQKKLLNFNLEYQRQQDDAYFF